MISERGLLVPMGSRGIPRGTHGAIGLVWWVFWWFIRYIFLYINDPDFLCGRGDEGGLNNYILHKWGIHPEWTGFSIVNLSSSMTIWFFAFPKLNCFAVKLQNCKLKLLNLLPYCHTYKTSQTSYNHHHKTHNYPIGPLERLLTLSEWARHPNVESLSTW